MKTFTKIWHISLYNQLPYIEKGYLICMHVMRKQPDYKSCKKHKILIISAKVDVDEKIYQRTGALDFDR